VVQFAGATSMYYQLMGSFLDANDSIAFSNFDYRDIRFAAPQP